MEIIDVKGTVDTHIHSAPCLYDRVGDDWEIAKACRAAGMRAIVLKSHHESTVSRAFIANQRFAMTPPSGDRPSAEATIPFEVFGGITLNRYVGGINPDAAGVALQLGGRIVWMPTIDARHHGEVMGGFGNLAPGMDTSEGGTFQGISVLEHGRLTAQAYEIIDLIAKHRAVLATSHLDDDEVLALAEEGPSRGARVVINHPFWFPRTKDLTFYKRLAGLGAYLELCAILCFPAWPYSSYEENMRLIEVVGEDHCTIASDAGNVFTPYPHETLRVYLQNMARLGLGRSQIRKMTVEGPARLLGIALD